jgi:hypothetical protein
MKTIRFETMLTEDVERLRNAIKDAVNNGESFVIERQPGLGVGRYIEKIAIGELNLEMITICLHWGDELSYYGIPKNTLVVIDKEVKAPNEEGYGIRYQFEVFYNR